MDNGAALSTANPKGGKSLRHFPILPFNPRRPDENNNMSDVDLPTVRGDRFPRANLCSGGGQGVALTTEHA